MPVFAIGDAATADGDGSAQSARVAERTVLRLAPRYRRWRTKLIEMQDLNVLRPRDAAFDCAPTLGSRGDVVLRVVRERRQGVAPRRRPVFFLLRHPLGPVLLRILRLLRLIDDTKRVDNRVAAVRHSPDDSGVCTGTPLAVLLARSGNGRQIGILLPARRPDVPLVLLRHLVLEPTAHGMTILRRFIRCRFRMTAVCVGHTCDDTV